jgi:hypothetical protein
MLLLVVLPNVFMNETVALRDLLTRRDAEVEQTYFRSLITLSLVLWKRPVDHRTHVPCVVFTESSPKLLPSLKVLSNQRGCGTVRYSGAKMHSVKCRRIPHSVWTPVSHALQLYTAASYRTVPYRSRIPRWFERTLKISHGRRLSQRCGLQCTSPSHSLMPC